jgi:hypothetical protein
LAAVLICSASVTGAVDKIVAALPAQLFEVTTETVMPHLEENLRYTTTHETRCLARLPLATAFPILRHPALKGCTLTQETRKETTVAYVLVCSGGHGTTGGAIWHIDDARIHGTLSVRLGGKNMTFSQRVTAHPRGFCSG